MKIHVNIQYIVLSGILGFLSILSEEMLELGPYS